MSVLDAVGVGDVKVAPTKINAPALISNGRPEVLYVGAEYCPYCAAERSAVAVALSRFGTLHGLGQTASSPNDVYDPGVLHGKSPAEIAKALSDPASGARTGRRRHCHSDHCRHLYHDRGQASLGLHDDRIPRRRQTRQRRMTEIEWTPQAVLSRHEGADV